MVLSFGRMRCCEHSNQSLSPVIKDGISYLAELVAIDFQEGLCFCHWGTCTEICWANLT
jgi:hypothetical protein